MFGVLLTVIGTFFDEISSTLGKDTVAKKEQSVYAMGFTHMFLSAVVLLGIIIVFPDSFRFSLGSLPTFIPRAFLEVLQAHLMVSAIVKAERSTYGMGRVLTIPLLLLADMLLGYSVGPLQGAGMALMACTLLFVFTRRGIGTAGLGETLVGAVNAVFTISLYKYNITHFNSVAAEQIIVYAVLLLYFFLAATFIARDRVFSLFLKPSIVGQSFSQAIAGVVESFAYPYAPASVIMAAKRSSAVLWSIISGGMYFKENRITVKLFTFALLSAGIVLLVL